MKIRRSTRDPAAADQTTRFATLVRDSREQAGLSQIELARKLKYSSGQFVSNWERGASTPPLSMLPVISQFLNVPSDILYEAILKDRLARLEEKLEREYQAALRKIRRK